MQPTDADDTHDPDHTHTSETTEVDTDRLLAILHARAPQRLARFAHSREQIAARLRERWGTAFDSYDLLLLQVGDALDLAERTVVPLTRQRRGWKFEALRILTARALRTAKEVRILLETGYPAGAGARYRTIHELYVIARLLDSHDDELAERYLKFSTIAKHRTAIMAQSHYANRGETMPPGSAEVVAEVEKEYQKLKSEYPNDQAYFARGDYQWAASTIGKGKQATGEASLPFAELEAAAQLADRRLMVRLVSEDIHSGANGAVSWATHGESLIPAGPVMEGLAVRGASAAIDLSGICELYLANARKVVKQGASGASGVSLDRELVFMIAILPALASETLNAFQQIEPMI